MVYYPYFRGKQFELLAIRETADLLARSQFTPIIEPVREALRGLEKTLKTISDAGGRAIVIVNPKHGDYSANGENITALLREGYRGNDAISAGILLRSDMTLDEAMTRFDEHEYNNPVIVHAGFTAPKLLAEHLGDRISKELCNVFVEDDAQVLYRRHFDGATRVLIRDGFSRQRNADYVLLEEFSELHVTYGEIGMDGFGDFLVVGDVYSEGGGPAYAVAIHLTFIDSDKDDVMYVYHFVSDARDTPTDPAGKFGQALAKLIATLDSGTSKLLETSSIREFRDLHAKGHFPGLGYVKKLSMKHHLETLATYLG